MVLVVFVSEAVVMVIVERIKKVDSSLGDCQFFSLSKVDNENHGFLDPPIDAIAALK
jgi:hypothetical protein